MIVVMLEKWLDKVDFARDYGSEVCRFKPRLSQRWVVNQSLMSPHSPDKTLVSGGLTLKKHTHKTKGQRGKAKCKY